MTPSLLFFSAAVGGLHSLHSFSGGVCFRIGRGGFRHGQWDSFGGGGSGGTGARGLECWVGGLNLDWRWDAVLGGLGVGVVGGKGRLLF